MTLRTILGLVALLHAAVSGAQQNLCGRADVQRAVGPGGTCKVSIVLLRVDGLTENATLATVTGEARSRTFFLQAAQGEPVALGPFPPLARPQEDRIVRALGFTESTAGPLSRIFEQALEKAPEGYCVVYRLRPPFTGTVKNCDGNPVGKVGFAPGVTSPRAAHKAVCELVAGSGPCDSGGVQVMAPEAQYEQDGSMYYAIRTVERLGTLLDLKSQYEMRAYRVEAAGGAVRLLGKSAEACTASGACTPLPGGVVR